MPRVKRQAAKARAGAALRLTDLPPELSQLVVSALDAPALARLVLAVKVWGPIVRSHINSPGFWMAPHCCINSLGRMLGRPLSAFSYSSCGPCAEALPKRVTEIRTAITQLRTVNSAPESLLQELEACRLLQPGYQVPMTSRGAVQGTQTVDRMDETHMTVVREFVECASKLKRKLDGTIQSHHNIVAAMCARLLPQEVLDFLSEVMALLRPASGWPGVSGWADVKTPVHRIPQDEIQRLNVWFFRMRDAVLHSLHAEEWALAHVLKLWRFSLYAENRSITELFPNPPLPVHAADAFVELLGHFTFDVGAIHDALSSRQVIRIPEVVALQVRLAELTLWPDLTRREIYHFEYAEQYGALTLECKTHAEMCEQLGTQMAEAKSSVEMVCTTLEWCEAQDADIWQVQAEGEEESTSCHYESSTAFIRRWAAASPCPPFPRAWSQEDHTMLMDTLRTSEARLFYMPSVVKWMVQAASNPDTDERALIVLLGNSMLD